MSLSNNRNNLNSITLQIISNLIIIYQINSNSLNHKYSQIPKNNINKIRIWVKTAMLKFTEITVPITDQQNIKILENHTKLHSNRNNKYNKNTSNHKQIKKVFS